MQSVGMLVIHPYDPLPSPGPPNIFTHRQTYKRRIDVSSCGEVNFNRIGCGAAHTFPFSSADADQHPRVALYLLVG